MKRLDELGISKFPWELNNHRTSPYVGSGHVIDPDGFLVAEACGEDYETINATARLIAAAPELYDAAERVIRLRDSFLKGDWSQDCPPMEKCETALEDLRKALAKAAGEDETK